MRIRKMMKMHIAMSDKMQQAIADEIGIGSSTLTRFIGGKNVDQDATIKIIAWLFSEEE